MCCDCVPSRIHSCISFSFFSVIVNHAHVPLQLPRTWRISSAQTDSETRIWGAICELFGSGFSFNWFHTRENRELNAEGCNSRQLKW